MLRLILFERHLGRLPAQRHFVLSVAMRPSAEAWTSLTFILQSLMFARAGRVENQIRADPAAARVGRVVNQRRTDPTVRETLLPRRFVF